MTSEADTASGEEPLPDADFNTIVLSLVHSALFHLGEAPDPTGETAAPNLPMAKHTIDLLALLQEKTKGNLTGEEERIVDQALYDLRMRFVEVSRKQ